MSGIQHNTGIIIEYDDTTAISVKKLVETLKSTIETLDVLESRYGDIDVFNFKCFAKHTTGQINTSFTIKGAKQQMFSLQLINTLNEEQRNDMLNIIRGESEPPTNPQQ